MPARSGQDYFESLRKCAPRVYLGGRLVADVTAEPVFQEPIRAIAEQYDMQLDPAYRDVMTYLCLRLHRGGGVRGWGREGLGRGRRGGVARARRALMLTKRNA